MPTIVPKQTIKNVVKDSENDIKVSAPTSGINVTAIQKGFYGQERIAEGRKFVIKDESHFGKWMVCDDPDMEVKRKKHFKAKDEEIKQMMDKKANK